MPSGKSFASVIRVNVALLRFSGVLSHKSESVRRLSAQNVLGAFAYGCLFAYTILYIYEFALYTVHLDTWTESFAMILSIVGGCARFTFVLLFRGRFQRLLTICEELWATLNATEKKYVCDYVKATKHLTYYYLFGCVFTIFFYVIASLFMNTTRSLPYTCPIEITRSPYYEIMYAMQLCSMINVALTCIGTDTIGPVLILTICGHFKVLNTRILSLSDRPQSKESRPSAGSLGVTSEKSRKRGSVKYDLAAYVYYHQTIFQYVYVRIAQVI